MMNHPSRDDDRHLIRLFSGMSFIVGLTVIMILGVEGTIAVGEFGYRLGETVINKAIEGLSFWE